jgi:hypothetical protein
VLGGYKRKWLAPGAVGDDTSKVGSGHVFKSTDAGATFTDVSGNLPDSAAESVLVHGDQLVVATDVGVYTAQTKSGGSWVPLGSGLPNAPVVSMRSAPQDPDLMVAAVYGRGVYTYRFATAAAPVCADSAAPVSKVASVRLTRRGLVVRGTTSDRGCGKRHAGRLRQVLVAVARRSGKRCQPLLRSGRLGRRTSCARVRGRRAQGTKQWTFAVRHRLPKGRYMVSVRAVDSAGNAERARPRGRNVRRVTVRR